MGTRGFIGFVVDGTEKIAYNHWDSYPSGLGVEMLGWLRHAVSDVDGFAEKARALRVVSPSSEPTDEDIEQLAGFYDGSVGSKRERPDWYQLLRNTQGKPRAMLQAGVIEDASGFPTDSLFAEWGYVVDFDAKTFEVYQGFQRAAHDKGRFASRPGRDESYYPVALVASWPLSGLPADETFLRLDQDDED